jgi:hypothetical protein
MRLASGWTDTGNYREDGLLLELTAPAAYNYAPTRMKFYIFIPPVSTKYGSQATAHSLAVEDTTWISSKAVVSPVADCSVAAESAAVFGYADGNERGYRLSVVHKDFWYGIWLFGNGGVSDAALGDALGMMGSVVWTI